MAFGRTEGQVTWSAAISKTLNAATRFDSDEITIDADVVAISLSVRADNQGTPASGDVVDVFIKWSNGDLEDAAGANDFDTDEHAMSLMSLDTYAANTPGEDPCQKTLPIDPTWGKAFKLSVYCSSAATRNVIVAARWTMRTSA